LTGARRAAGTGQQWLLTMPPFAGKRV